MFRSRFGKITFLKVNVSKIGAKFKVTDEYGASFSG
jgi:hypothetical protein